MNCIILSLCFYIFSPLYQYDKQTNKQKDSECRAWARHPPHPLVLAVLVTIFRLLHDLKLQKGSV